MRCTRAPLSPSPEHSHTEGLLDANVPATIGDRDRAAAGRAHVAALDELVRAVGAAERVAAREAHLALRRLADDAAARLNLPGHPFRGIISSFRVEGHTPTHVDSILHSLVTEDLPDHARVQDLH